MNDYQAPLRTSPMTASDQKELRCSKCGSTDFEPIVQYGSYILRCGKCGLGTVATSWRSVGPQWNSRVLVHRDGESSPILEGIGADIWRHIAALTADGTTLVLRPTE